MSLGVEQEPRVGWGGRVNPILLRTWQILGHGHGRVPEGGGSVCSAGFLSLELPEGLLHFPASSLRPSAERGTPRGPDRQWWGSPSRALQGRKQTSRLGHTQQVSGMGWGGAASLWGLSQPVGDGVGQSHSVLWRSVCKLQLGAKHFTSLGSVSASVLGGPLCCPRLALRSVEALSAAHALPAAWACCSSSGQGQGRGLLWPLLPEERCSWTLVLFPQGWEDRGEGSRLLWSQVLPPVLTGATFFFFFNRFRLLQ